MKTLLIGIALGLILASAEVLAFHYFGHNPAADDVNRMQEQQERFNQQIERQQQELFRNQQRSNPC